MIRRSRSSRRPAPCGKYYRKKTKTYLQTQIKNVPYISGNYIGVQWGEIIEQLEQFKENLTLAEYRENGQY